LARLALAMIASLLAAALPQVSTAQDTGYLSTVPNGNPELPFGARDRFDRVRFMDGFSSHFIISHDPGPQHPLVFLPPVPPILESDIPVLAPFDSGPPAPAELSAFVGELFYPFLGARLAGDELPRESRAQILAYRDAKVSLQDEMRARVLALKEASPEGRAEQLAALASRQAPRIAQLEATAEKIRADLRKARVFQTTDLNDKPVWHLRPLGDMPTDPAAELAESVAIRGDAFYQNGLSAAQRRLLLEAAIELDVRAKGERPDAAPGTSVLYFSPETSRIRIPVDLPEPLGREVSDYQAVKRALMGELREALRLSEDRTIDSREDAMEKLAAEEAPRIAELDNMAEVIRRGLAALPNPTGPPSSAALPQALVDRITAYRAHKVELLRKLRSMLTAPTPIPNDGRVPKGPAPDPTEGALAWMHDGASKTEIQSTELRVSVEEFDRLQNQLIEELNKEENGIREELAAYARTNNGPTDRKSINDLLRDFERARQQQEIWDRYRDYQTAVLMPGLSAGQRQLLFDGGIEALALPLPDGETIH
jgi:hypothetical protein